MHGKDIRCSTPAAAFSPQAQPPWAPRLATPSGCCRCPSGISSFCKGGSVDVSGFHAVCAPGGMFFDNRWVYFCMTINWTATAETDPATVAAFAAAGSKALALAKQALSC